LGKKQLPNHDSQAEGRTALGWPKTEKQHPNNLRNEDQNEEELWAVEKWKSKNRIPTFPPPRMPAALGKNGRLHKTLDTPFSNKRPLSFGAGGLNLAPAHPLR
jgi:hypothetical protein